MGDRRDRALARIEAALARLERAASAPRSGIPDDDGALRALQARHERLREAVGQSLHELDSLIAGQQA